MADSIHQEALAHFSAVPWCKQLIDNPAYTTVLELTQMLKAQRESALFGATFAGANRIRHLLQLDLTPDHALLPHPIREILTFWDIGSGMDGYMGVAHGGFLAALLDHHTGSLLYENQGYVERHTGVRGVQSDVTVALDVRYRRPVPTPAIIVSRSRIVRIEPRKILVKGTIEDSKGRVLAEAEALFIQPKKPIGEPPRL